MKNADMPAMPIELNGNGLYEPCAYIGLTKREYFAALAMQGCRARNSTYASWEDMAKDAVEMADALLAELEKSK